MKSLIATLVLLFFTLIQSVYAERPPTNQSEVNSTLTEGNSNHTTYFLLQLSRALTSDVSVDYTTKGGTAIAGKDYITTSGTATIKAEQTYTTIPVTIIGDTIVEPDEEFSLALSNPKGISFPQGVTEISKNRTILNDDSTSVIEPTLPASIIMKSIPGGTFTMGNNNLLGPQAGQATEHEVTLSDFQFSEAEITNEQYVEFLNAALASGLIEVIISESEGPDNGKQVIIGTVSSVYSGKVFYNLDGTRVMKDHDNDDGDDNPFTGVIEPENPLNIAYIGFNDAEQNFYVKDPHSPDDFNWLQLCDYYDYGSTQGEFDTKLKNDFNNWPELVGWSEANPSAATGLPSKDNVSDYPVSYIRWWGAKAFVDFYGVKLPTEAQWEFAAKVGANFTYAVHDGADVADANWNQAQEHPAQHHLRAAISGTANPYGLYNLGGNVWEWMADNYQSYDTNAVVNPLVEISGSTTRSWRGGSWNYHQSTLESSARYYDDEDRGNDHFGFRIAN